MAEEVAKFSEGGGALEVEIVIGQNKTGTWDCYLYDSTGKVELEHHSGDYASDPFILTTATSALDKTLLFTDAILNGKKDQKWILTVNMRQNGKRIDGGERKRTGKFNSSVANVTDKVELQKK